MGSIFNHKDDWKTQRNNPSITESMDMNLRELQERVEGREAWRAAVYGIARSQKWLSDWTTTKAYNQGSWVLCLVR